MEKHILEEYVLSIEEWSMDPEGKDGVHMVSIYTKDGNYVGDIHDAEYYLKKKGLTQLQPSHEGSKQCAIGFCEREQKWYGWSHRAIYGFGIGSKVEKGDCAYQPANKEEFIIRELDFWTDEYNTTSAENITEEGFDLIYHYNNEVPNPDLKNKIHSKYVEFPKTFGRGEWTAKTLDDAKQMAIDFARGVA